MNYFYVVHLAGMLILAASTAMIWSYRLNAGNPFAWVFPNSERAVSWIQRHIFGSSTDDEVEQPEDKRQLEEASVQLLPGQRAMWTGRASNPLLILAAVLGGAAMAWHSPMFIAIGGLAWAATTGGASSVRVTVDRSGVRIRTWPMPVLSRHVPLARITGARCFNLRPSEWGGWGRHFMHQSWVYVVRGGPALAVELESGQAVMVTVDGAEQGAGLLNALSGSAGA